MDLRIEGGHVATHKDRKFKIYVTFFFNLIMADHRHKRTKPMLLSVCMVCPLIMVI